MMKSKLVFPILGIIFVSLGSFLAILFAKGYRPSLSQKTILPSGILVAQSYPDSAELLVNGALKTATNTSVNLDPGQYEVEIKKAGFVPWKKSLTVEAETVTRATATLFPSVPSLKAITTSGANAPLISPDGSKVVYLIPGKTNTEIYTLDLNESSFGFINRDPKSILKNSKLKIENLTWSPDSRQILLSSSGSATLIDVSSSESQTVPEKGELLLTAWNTQTATKELQKQTNLPVKLKEILTTSVRDLVWSPKENKILYTATSSATIPDRLIQPLPGSNTQPEARSIAPGNVYVYDLEEDKNFLVDTFPLPTPTPKNLKLKIQNTQPINAGWNWFSSSYHLMKVDSTKIYIKEYDNQNQTVIYSGPMATPFAAPYPSGKQILILSNLNPDNSPLPNLYAISLR